ncbi:MAG TPA: class I SAM-dependent methyltransferase [Chitinophagaceae bacterium]|nr:class I SAM-dependent methyltransferase [Chitinophagaceae bacterium]
MKSTDLIKTSSKNYARTTIRDNCYKPITDYYDIAGPDYEAWSKNFNMHFGYCTSFFNIFSLETMLNNMNKEVLSHLKIDRNKKTLIADLGCGVGTVSRYAARHFPLASITGITISDYQIDKGNLLNNQEDLLDQVLIIKDNFENLHMESQIFTHAYALESCCHARGAGKPFFISEMARVLKSDGRFCIADGFLKHDRKQPRLFSFIYKKILKYWALPCFGNINELEKTLEQHGFVNVTVKEISLRIAPSVAYVPWTCFKFFTKEIVKNKSLRMKKERWYNVYGPVLGMILGLYRSHFGYYIISGEKQ